LGREEIGYAFSEIDGGRRGLRGSHLWFGRRSVGAAHDERASRFQWPVAVPDELRAERSRLGFDYGKFDFVVHEGRAILLDANRTPSAPPPSPEVDASNVHLAGGIDSLLKR